MFLKTFDSTQTQRATMAPVQKGGGLMRCGECVTHLVTLALVAIAAVAASGALGGVAAGGTMIGLAVFLLIGNVRALVSAQRGESVAQKVSVIIRAIANVLAIVMGSLAITGVLPISTIGLVVLVPVGVTFIARCVIDYKWQGSALVRHFFKGHYRSLPN